MADPDDQPTVQEGPLSIDDFVTTTRGDLIGVEVGGYVVEAEIGHGGMGYVYSATHPVIGKRVAIKVLGKELSKNPASVERFVQEARSVNQIGHPNIVDIFAIGTLPDGRCYLVMDLLDGEPLRKRIKRGALPVQEAVIVIDEIAVALIAAHGKGFIHRDLKPDNVFLVANPNRIEIKLLDFGLAKLKSAGSLRAYRTATGALLGTPDYMSPEQIRGSGKVDVRTDIYALGVMAYEILTKLRPPREADGTFAIEGKSPAQIVGAVPGVPAELAELVQTMFAPDPARRPSLAAVRAVLKRVRPSLPAYDPVRALGTEPTLDSMSASLVGAKPLLPSPPAGSSVIEPPPPEPRYRPALRPPGQSVPGTKLGVPPPPGRPSQRHQVEVAALPKRKETKLWLIVALVILVTAAAALAFVLMS